MLNGTLHLQTNNIKINPNFILAKAMNLSAQHGCYKLTLAPLNSNLPRSKYKIFGLRFVCLGFHV